MAKVGKIVTIMLWVLLIISAVLVISLVVNISDNEADPDMGSWISTNLWWSYILMVVGAGIAIIASLIHMFSDIRAAKKGLISLVFLGVIVLVSYLLASDEIPRFLGAQKLMDEGILTAQVSKLVDAGLIATYILLGLAALSVAFSGVARLFK